MSSILYGIHSKQVLTESCHGLNREQKYIVEGIYNEFRPIIEATLTADQIGQLFTNIEKSATTAGGNRTMLGKGIDAGKAVNQAIDNVGKWLQNTTPVQAFDQKYEDLKNKIGAKFPGLEKNLTAMGTWAKENPGKTAAIIGVLTTIAALAGGPAGGAIAGQILRGTTELLKGEKISTAVGKGVKTAAIGALAGYGIDKIGDMLSGGVRMVADNLFPGAQKLNLSFSAYGTGPSTFQNIPDVVGRAKDLAPIQSAFQNASQAWNSGDYSKAYSLFQQAKDAAAKLSDPSFVAQLTKDQEARSAIMQGAKGIMQASDAFAAAAQGAASGAGAGGLKKQATTESRSLTDKQVKLVFEGVMSWLGKKAGNLTTKVTADKLMSAWKKAGSPTDSAQIATLLTQNGVSKDIVDNVFAQMKISSAPAQPQQAQPAQQPAAPSTTGVNTAPQAAVQPATAPAKPGVNPELQKRLAARKAGKPIYSGGLEEAEGDTLLDPETALLQARKITKAIKYENTSSDIIVQMQMLAERTEGVDKRALERSIDDVYAAQRELESAVYGLEEAFEDAVRSARYKRDEEEDDLYEMPDTSGPVGVQPGGWRRTDKDIEEDTAYAGGMGQGGNAGESYRKFRPKVAGTFKRESAILKGLQ